MLLRAQRVPVRLRTVVVLLGLTILWVGGVRADVKPHAGMLRYPDVGATHIVFQYANNLWLVPREGGLASPVTSTEGQELNARFSPDSQTLAFSADYGGGRDLYTIPVTGGVPQRMTHHPSVELLCDWTPDGKLLFATNGFSGLARTLQLYTVSEKAPLPPQLPVPYGSNGAISPDGQWLAYTPYSRDTRTWKRYRGGMASDIWLFHLEKKTAQRITDWEGTDTLPMWHGQTVYYLSDAGPASTFEHLVVRHGHGRAPPGHRVLGLRREVALDRSGTERSGRDRFPVRCRAVPAGPEVR